jgi:hypothetical protein
MSREFNAEVWGPHYWHLLHSISYCYPEFPNEVTKRKYYDLIQNFPLFIPNIKMGDKFSEFLDKYPVTPYLDNRESFIRWMNFIHNKYNKYLGKAEITVFEGIDRYNAQYSPKEFIYNDTLMYKKYVFYSIIIIILLGIGYWNIS